jgi:pyrimidine operon attenuation protein/uracil phosphoribosyltransferase
LTIFLYRGSPRLQYLGPVAPPKTIGSREVHAAIERLAAAIEVRHRRTQDLFVLGIANGGIPLAHRLAERLGIKRVGDLDISFHRDDIGKHPIPKEFAVTLLPGDVNGATVLLVDDVLFTGRTIKAALDELFDHGRPATVELAVLVDRGHRRLPIVADFSGSTIDAADDEDVVVSLHDDPARDRIEIRARRTGAPRAPVTS